MKAGIKYLIFSIAIALSTCSCDEKPVKTGDTLPELPEGGIVYLDLRRYESIDRKDTSAVNRTWDVLHCAATLQGIVNRETPQIYVDYVGFNGTNIDRYWWDMYREPGKWLAGRETVTLYDPVKVADMFRDRIKGLVVYDSNVASTSCVASTVAGAEDLIAVRYDPTPGSVYTRFMKRGYEVKVWLVNEDGTSKFHSKIEPYQWAVDNYLKTGKCTGEYAAYYIDQYWRKSCSNATFNHHQLVNHDFFIGKRAFFFDLSPWEDEVATDAPGEPVGADAVMMKQILMELYRLNGGQKMCHIGGFPAWAYKYSTHGTVGGKHVATSTEWHFAEIISQYNAFKDADAIAHGAMANASFWSHYPLKEKYPQKWVTRDELKAKGYLTADGKINRTKKFILFYVGDYDAASWIYQRMPDLWDDPARGKVPLMWSISPILCRRAPMVMEHLWESATENDYFAAADNGAGYLNPGALEEPRKSGLPSGVKAWEEHNIPFYRQWDITVSGFIIDGDAVGMTKEGFESYSKYSYNGIVPQRAPKNAFLCNGMPVMRSQGGTGSDTAEGSANSVVSSIYSRTNGFPFFWYRTVLKSPSWHLAVKERIEILDKNAVWCSGPEFFELLRCYLEEENETI